MRMRDRIEAWGGTALLAGLRVLKIVCRPRGLRGCYRALLMSLVKRTGLFDHAYYLETNSDVAQTGTSPLRHYVSYGDKEGRSPMPFFDPAYYRSHARGRTKSVNALLHYAYVGRRLGVSPSPWFDVRYYLANNKDVARHGIDPLLHYLRWGGEEGRLPCAQFDGAHYLRTYPDVAESRINPLLHYLLWGRREGRHPVPVPEEGGDASEIEIPTPSLPDEQSWSSLTPRANIAGAAVDVVVPVYKGRVETLRCIYSVLVSNCETPFDLVVINDASPDPELSERLRALAEAGLFVLLENEENRGFVRTANRGMSLHPGRDVVLLNSDAEVYDGWLDRLRSAALCNPGTATVTPLSNNATICSYPRFLHDNPFLLEIGYAELDALAAKVNAGTYVEAPTGVGFCLYVARAALHEVGLFDEDAFGKGYGEENDFCQRAIKKGWRNLIAADVFVRHWGAASFQGEKAKRIDTALDRMDERHPNYRKDVAEFIKRDPLAEARRRIDWARMKRLCGAKNLLIVCHNRGGGTERHVQEDIRRLTPSGYSIFLLRPVPGRPTHASLTHHRIQRLVNMAPFDLRDETSLIAALRELGIVEVHTHGLVDFSADAPQRIARIVKALQARWEVNIHDYKVICPRLNLADENGLYCGEPEDGECNRCLSRRGSDFQITDIVAWRRMHGEALRRADRVLVPDDDVARRLKKYFPGIAFELSPHEENDWKEVPVRIPSREPGEKTRVVVIGAISKVKGFEILLSCAKDARSRGLPLEFTVMGYSMNDRLLQEAGVQVTGKYQEEQAEDLLRRLDPHIVWLPSMWPETYSYTLSIAFRAGLPVAAFDIGAIASRLRAAGKDQMLMDLALASRPAEINRRLIVGVGEATARRGKIPATA
jgi:GT2 family glycosyltransferase